MDRTKGVSLAKGPVGIIGVVLLAGGILGLLFGSTDFTTNAPNGDVTGATFLGIEGNGWTWLGFAGAGAILLVSAPLHWGAKTMALIVGVVMVAACVIAIIDGNDVFGVVAANRATMFVMGVAGIALLVLAMMPRVGRRPREGVVEDDATTARRGRFAHRRRATTDEPVRTTGDERVGTGTERRV
jgi:hypothetical protein